MSRRSLIIAGLVCLGAVIAGRAIPAHAASFDNGQWTATLTGPSTAVVGYPATYTLSIKNDHPLAVGLNPPFTVSIPAGAMNISVTASGCAGTLSSTVSPATYTSCPTMPNYLISGNGTVTYQITLTPTAVNPAFVVTYKDPTGPSISQQTLVIAPVHSSTTNTAGDPPASYDQLHYSGQGWDPRCMYGCPPGGLP